MNILRPTKFREVVGQKDLKNRLLISIRSAIQRKQPMSHILLDGPPGLGKTTIAGCIASALGIPMYSIIGPMLDATPEVITFVLKASNKAVLFIDEIHRLPVKVEEFLYPVLEDGRLEIENNLTHIDLPPITFIGATTQSGSLSKPFRDRFPIRESLEYYSTTELATLVRRNATKLNIDLDGPVSRFIAGVSRGTPRIANNRLSWIRDYANSHNKKQITLSVVLDAMTEQGIDPNGLEKRDRKVLKTMDSIFDGKPVGVASLASACSLAKETLEEEIEPWLLYCGLITRTPRGRMLTEAGQRHLIRYG